MIDIDIPIASAGSATAVETSAVAPAPITTTTPYATGRRKRAVAQVRLRPGTGQVTVNGRDGDEYFKRPTSMLIVRQPFEVTGQADKWDVTARLTGGGPSGQAGALRHGIARCLVQTNPDLRQPLRKAGLLTRDPRQVERQKPGQPGARKKFQFSKR